MRIAPTLTSEFGIELMLMLREDKDPSKIDSLRGAPQVLVLGL
jgi:hypothetical protein